MTKKDFELIALSVRLARPGLRIDQGNDLTGLSINAQHTALDLFSQVIAERLANDNPRFDRERFLKACGVA